MIWSALDCGMFKDFPRPEHSAYPSCMGGNCSEAKSETWLVAWDLFHCCSHIYGLLVFQNGLSSLHQGCWLLTKKRTLSFKFSQRLVYACPFEAICCIHAALQILLSSKKSLNGCTHELRCPALEPASHEAMTSKNLAAAKSPKA